MIHLSTDEKTLRVKAEGHAGFAKRGEDIVCAAVSILMYCYVAELIRLGVKPQIRDEGESLEIAPRKNLDEAKAAFETVSSGFRLLADDYAKHVRLEEK